MRLSDLVAGATATVPAATSRDVEIAGLTADSRRVGAGFLFAALPGAANDGRAYIADAVRRGAVAVLAPSGTALPAGLPAVALLLDDNPRRALALAAARFHGRQPRVVVAVTGTNGKTSVAAFARQIWLGLGKPAASLGTLGVVANDRDRPGSLTTPDPVALHATLAELATAGIEHAAIEASSHGLDQYRLDGVRLSAAAFTNLSRDHLDYHGTMERYFAAKRRLFAELLPTGAAAVVNADAAEHDALAATCRAAGLRLISYGRAGRDLRLEAVAPTATGQRLEVSLSGRRHRLDFPVAGGFQAHNLLCALGLVIGAGEDADAALATVAGLSGVPGRIELAARHPNGAPVYVDYAHTPDALATVLGALRPHAHGRLAVVFGCGGDRDRGKRPEMGAVAARLADRVVVTDDNPRSEPPATIRAAILAGCPGAREIGDRAAAIAEAIAGLAPDDLLVIAGKGHETGQTVAGVVHPFDDRAVARAAVARIAADGAAR
jgi:UDP-N-acetylmuramoyl-L-alanyl-D-glutamate--2,6-diaminopimelate ligase